MNVADDQPYRAEKLMKRGMAGKDASPNFAPTPELQKVHSSPPLLSLPVASYDVKVASSNHIRPPRSYENLVPKGYILAIISLLSIFALSGSFMFALSYRHSSALDGSWASAYIPYPKLGYPRFAGRLQVSQTFEPTRSNAEIASEVPTISQRSESSAGSQRLVLGDNSSTQDEWIDVDDRSFPSGKSAPDGCTSIDAKLKVYMYNLPPEFHYGMISKHLLLGGKIWPSNVTDIPRYPGGLYQQHSPEYWLTSDLLTSNMPDRRSSCTAFRVDDWKSADVLFVPFFASLSYNKYTKTEHKHEVDKNEELQEKLVKYLKRQQAWQDSGGCDHVIVIHHPNSMHVVRAHLRTAIFVVADFGRYPSQVANIDKDIVAPYKHVIPSYAEDLTTFENRRTLLFFQGAIVRKEGGIIRQQLYELLKDESGVHFATGNTQSDGIRSATQGMRSSKFCLHLAGDTPSSNRLFDAISSHCMPVIISDEIELPYEDELDYTEFCLFIKSTDALRKGFVIKLLRSVKRVEWTKMWERLHQVDHHFKYQHPTQPDDAVNMVWKAIARKLPSVKFLLHKQRRYSRSDASHAM